MSKDLTPGTKLEDSKNKPNVEIISKEETMFRVGNDGKALPEKYQIQIYDRNLDRELIEESFLLLETIKKQKAILSVLGDSKKIIENELNKLKEDIKKETDEKIIKKLQIELNTKERMSELETIKGDINLKTIENGIIESREILEHLNSLKESSTIINFVEIIPCTTSEAYLAFEKGRSIEGKDTNDWVADLISKKLFNPKYTFEEAKLLRPDFKIAMKEAIMQVSNYKTQSYRDLLMEKNLKENKPLTIKKE